MRLLIATVMILSSSIMYEASAVPPPEFIIQAASQIGVFFSISVAFLSAIYASFFKYIKLLVPRYKKYLLGIGLLAILLLSGIGAYFYDQYYQETVQADQKLNSDEIVPSLPLPDTTS